MRVCSVPSISEVIRKSLIHIKLNHITLVGGHCSGFCFDVVRMPAEPAANNKTSVCHVSHSVLRLLAAVVRGYDGLGAPFIDLVPLSGTKVIIILF